MKSIVTLLAVLFLAIGCNSANKSLSKPEHTLERAFNALKNGSWEEYSELVVTTADFDLRATETSKFLENQSYAGSVLKPEQLAQHKEEFGIAVAGGRQQIEFRNSEYISIGSEIGGGDWELLSGGSIPYKTYSLKLRLDGKPIDTKDLTPAFHIVEWGSFYKIIGLKFDGIGPDSQ